MSKNERFAAIDFETMDSDRSTVCAVGVTIFEGSEIVDVYHSLISPNTCFENPYCKKTHGLTIKECRQYPEFPEIWKIVEQKIKGCKLVAHNASFERGCINACNEVFGTNNNYEYIDTLAISRHCLNNLKSHTLDKVCKHLNISLTHHNAMSDSLACAMLFIKLSNMYDIDEIMKEIENKRKKRKNK